MSLEMTGCDLAPQPESLARIAVGHVFAVTANDTGPIIISNYSFSACQQSLECINL